VKYDLLIEESDLVDTIKNVSIYYEKMKFHFIFHYSHEGKPAIPTKKHKLADNENSIFQHS
jgi:hypothetical protein